MEAKTQTISSSLLSFNKMQDNVFHCPSCNVKVGVKEVATHLQIEIERLRQIQADAETNKTTLPDEEALQRKKPHSIFQRIQRNRQARLRQRTRKRLATPPAPAEPICPICNQSFPNSEIQRHAEKCLRKSNGCNGADDHSSNDEEDGCIEDTFEEYEWAGQKRIRASSLLDGGYASIGIGQSVSNCNGVDEDDDEDLNVDEDDTQIYGPTQYNESDVIPTNVTETSDRTNNNRNEDDVTSYMRSLITSGEPKSNTSVTQTQESFVERAKRKNSNESVLNCQPCSSTSISTSSSASSTNQIIDSLKAKLSHYENHTSTKYKCLICLDDYRNPAISVSCWHVHCEECWLRSLGSRKLCPQCNLITTPKDLRRIYL